MVKYGKEYKAIQIEEWRKYYFNYKALKQKIKQMKQTLSKYLRQNQYINNKIISNLSNPLIPDDLSDIGKEKDNEKEPFTSMYRDEKGKFLKEFVELFIQEFKKSYNFFIGIQNVLIKKINTHLYTQTSYSSYNLQELSKEMKSLSLTVYLVKCLNDFINDIMTAMKKILKKFDKNFSKLFGNITPHLILQLLNKKNSELENMLQFKIIDEISTISQSNTKELKHYFDQNNEILNEKNAQYRLEFLVKYNETLKYINDIDNYTNFKTQYKDWTDYVSGRNTLRKGFKYFENDIFNPILSASYYRDNLLDKFLSTKEAFNEAKKLQNKITTENKINIILICIQVFFYNSLLSCIFPLFYYYEYIRSLGDEQKIFNSLWFVNFFLFFIVGFIYLAQFLSIFFFYNYTSRKNIKNSYLLSYFFTFIGSVLYILSIISGQGHFKVRGLIIGISRTFIGLGSNPMVGKKYITIYSPRYYLPLISKIYLIVELSGFILGPTIAALFIYIEFGEIFCLFNAIGYYGAIGSFVLFFINLFAFEPPQSEKFLIFKNKGNISQNYSSSSGADFENIDDIQDQEFYKLQKDKIDKNIDKSSFSSAKSDDINIEINDDPQKTSNKSVNNTVDSNLNEEKLKEEEEDNYDKIMKEAGDLVGQNEIAENYYNNVDVGRYSNLDISNEEQKDINEIMTKLYEYQEKSNFTYIDMIPRTLDDLILNEQKTLGYLNRNLIIMLVLLLFNNLIKENLIVHFSYSMLFRVYKNGSIITGAEEIHNSTIIDYNKTDINNDTDLAYFIEVVEYITNSNSHKTNENLKNHILKYSSENKLDIQIICFLTSIVFLFQLASFFFIIPFYKINIVFKKYLIIFMFLSFALMVPLFFSLFFKYIYLYTPLVAIDIFFHKIIEIICSSYLVYLIPPKWKYAHIRASSLPVYLMNFGKFCGCLICVLSIDQAHYYNQYAVAGITFLVYGLIGIFIYRSKNLRISTLSRILRQREEI